MTELAVAVPSATLGSIWLTEVATLSSWVCATWGWDSLTIRWVWIASEYQILLNSGLFTISAVREEVGGGYDLHWCQFGGEYIGLLTLTRRRKSAIDSGCCLSWKSHGGVTRALGLWPTPEQLRTSPESILLYIRRIAYFMSSLSCVNSIFYQLRRILQYLMSYVKKYESLIVTRLHVWGMVDLVCPSPTNVYWLEKSKMLERERSC